MKMMREPAVRREIKKIMDTPEQNPKVFMSSLWAHKRRLEKYLEDETLGPPPKHIVELGMNADRLLARGYISEVKSAEPPKPLNVDGLDAGIANLTGLKPATEVKQ